MDACISRVNAPSQSWQLRTTIVTEDNMVQPSTQKKYFELTKKQLYKRLEKRGYSAGNIYNLIERAQLKRKSLLRESRMYSGVYNPWNEMIEELLAEMHRTRAKIDKYVSEKHNHPERVDLFKSYLALLQKRLYGLRLKQQREKHTPEALGKPHWSDWIPDEVKHPFIERHAQLFNRPNTRTAAPLFSKQKVVIQTQKSKRVDSWQQDLLAHQISYDHAVAEQDTAKAAWAEYSVQCIAQAIRRLADIGIHSAPVSWMGLLTSEERAELDRLAVAFTNTDEKVYAV
jgi:hypothetical protein